MQREIKFRGLCARTRKWVYGYLSNYDVINTDNGQLKVIPESVSQLHNGLSKKTSGQEVYVGDEISFDLTAGLCEPPSYGHKELVSTVERCASWYTNVRVIGNIHESEVTNV